MRLISRVLIGGLFVGHGTQKLFGWFSGHGLDGTAGYFEALGLQLGKRNALVAGVAEAGGGALFARGLALPLAGAALAGTMTTAIRHVHGPKAGLGRQTAGPSASSSRPTSSSRCRSRAPSR